MNENSYTEYLRKQREKEAQWEKSPREGLQTNFSISKKWLSNYPNNENPKIEVVPTVFDKVLNISGYVVLIVFWIATWYIISVSPEIVPIHFGSDGKANGFGSKDTHWLLPVIATLFFLLMTIIPITRKPWIANYPVKITVENAERQYRYMVRFFYGMKIMFSLFFIGLVVATFQASKMAEPKLALWFIPMFLLFFVSIFIYFAFVLIDKPHKTISA